MIVYNNWRLPNIPVSDIKNPPLTRLFSPNILPKLLNRSVSFLVS